MEGKRPTRPSAQRPGPGPLTNPTMRLRFYRSRRPSTSHPSRSRVVTPDPPRERHSESCPASPRRTGRLRRQTRCSPACRSPVNGDSPGERIAAHTPFRSKAWYRTTHQSDHAPTSSRSSPPRLRPSPRAPIRNSDSDRSKHQTCRVRSIDIRLISPRIFKQSLSAGRTCSQ